MYSGIAFIIVIVLASITIIISSIAIIISIRFQNKQKKKYDECIQIINENKYNILSVKDSLTPEDIYNIDNTINVESLMNNLYNTYLKFEDKIKNFNSDLDDVLTGYLKYFYINKIKNFKENGYADIKDNIELIAYSIIEFSEKKLKFRININCFDYKMINDQIVSGSNSIKVEQVLLLSYEKINGNWLIYSYDKIYEKKLSN